MIFKKDVAKIVLHLKEGFTKDGKPWEVIEGTISKYDLNVNEVVRYLKSRIANDLIILLDGDTYGTAGETVNYFEITNYDELLELLEEREENAE